LDALCEIAVAEPFTEYLVPRILSFITEKCQADECSAGIRSLRLENFYNIIVLISEELDDSFMKVNKTYET
jgi:hypothetical protein